MGIMNSTNNACLVLFLIALVLLIT